MIDIKEMFDAHPMAGEKDFDAARECMKVCFECAEFCLVCADACMAEDHVADLRGCIRLNLDCAVTCKALGTVLARRIDTDWTFVLRLAEACERACKLCEEECRKHASMHEHCKLCAEICYKCKQACKDLIQEGINLG